MSRALLILSDEASRDLAASWIRKAPDGSRVEFKRPKRSLDQNALMWAAVTEVATQTKHHSFTLTPNDWKLLFLNQLKRELRTVPNLDGDGLVSLGRSSSDLTKEEMSDLIELIFEYGARRGVKFKIKDME